MTFNINENTHSHTHTVCLNYLFLHILKIATIVQYVLENLFLRLYVIIYNSTNILHVTCFNNRLVVSGQLIHYFYILLDKIMPQSKEAKVKSGIKRVLLDRLLFAPPFILFFLYAVSIMEVGGFVF